MEYRKNLYTCQDGIGRITMNYPKNLNAIDMDMVLELLSLLEVYIKSLHRIRIVHIVGNVHINSADYINDSFKCLYIK